MRWVFWLWPEKGTQKQQQLQMKLSGIQTGKSPEEKDTISPLVVPARVVIHNNSL